MRAFAFLALAGCLGSPTGKSQDWPLHGAQVTAAVAVNLDDDANDEIVIAAAGDTPGLFVFDDTDLDLAADNVLPRFSTYQPRDIPQNAGLVAVGDFVVIATPGEDGGIELQRLSGLDLAGDAPAIIGAARPAPMSPLWMHTVPFPGNQLRVAVSSDDTIFHFLPDAPQDVMNEFPPMGVDDGWRDSQLATGFVDGSDHQVVVATTTELRRGAPPFQSWELVRAGPNEWLGQITATIEGHDVVIGFDTTVKALCAIDITAPAPTAPACMTDATFDGVLDAEIVFGPISVTDQEPDISVVFDLGSAVKAELWLSPTFDGTTFAGSRGVVGTALMPRPMGPLVVLVAHDAAHDLVVLDRNGLAVCDPNAPACE